MVVGRGSSYQLSLVALQNGNSSLQPSMNTFRILRVGWIFLMSAIVVRSAEIRTFRLPTLCMQPTIPQNALINVSLDDSYRSKIQRFDIIAYKFEEGGFKGQTHIKRVIGLPGEEIQIREQEVTINGSPLQLPSSIDKVGLALKVTKLRIPDDAVFVLGDYTRNSADSRYIGPIPLHEVLGQFIGLKE